jgi:hypothetical protein
MAESDKCLTALKSDMRPRRTTDRLGHPGREAAVLAGDLAGPGVAHGNHKDIQGP